MNWMARTTRILAVAAIALATQAQSLPQQLLNTTRGMQGDTIRVCVDDHSAGGKLDRAIAQSIADALFLKAEFVEAIRGFPLDGDGYLAELQVQLTNDCDLFMGISVQASSPFPDWATVTRSYAQIPFVLATLDNAYQRLSDIPYDQLLGTALGSVGERVFITTMLQRPQDQRWKRIPYPDHQLMLTRLRDGKLAAMLLWLPSLQRLADQGETIDDLSFIDFDPVPQSVVQVGALVRTSDTYLRTQVDAAIDELTNDGTFSQIITELGLALPQ